MRDSPERSRQLPPQRERDEALSRYAARRAVRYLITPAGFTRSITDVADDGPIFHIVYETALGCGTVDVTTDPMKELPSSDWRPLRRRALAMLGVSLALLLLGAIWTAAFAFRDPWFLRYDRGWVAGLVFATIVAMPLLGAMAVANYALALGARGGRRGKVWLPAVVAGVVLVAISSQAAQPSAEKALRALRSGDATLAYRTAVAARALNLSAPGSVRAIADESHLRLVESTLDPVSLAALVLDRWDDPERQGRAKAHLREVAEGHAWSAFQRHDPQAITALSEMVKELLPETSTRLSALAATTRADACLNRGDYGCAAREAHHSMALGPAIEETRETSRRVSDTLERRALDAVAQLRQASTSGARRDALAKAVEAATQYELVGSSPIPPGARVLSEQLARVDRTIADARAEKERKAAALEQRRREQEEARDARRRNAWATAPLLCNDGSLSPSCICAGSHRGCCSHHGGVARCSSR